MVASDRLSVSSRLVPIPCLDASDAAAVPCWTFPCGQALQRRRRQLLLMATLAKPSRERAPWCDHTGDAVSVDDGGQPMRDHDGGAADHEAVERRLYQLLALAVQGARRLRLEEQVFREGLRTGATAAPTIAHDSRTFAVKTMPRDIRSVAVHVRQDTADIGFCAWQLRKMVRTTPHPRAESLGS